MGQLIKIFILLNSTALLWGCSKSNDPEVDCNLNDLDLSVQSVLPAICGQSNGSVSLLASGGEGNYQYAIEGNAEQKSATFSNLSAGTYTFIVSDAVGCEVSLEAEVVEESDIAIATTTMASGCNESNGSIEISASGGDGTYTYSLDGVNFQTNNQFIDLPANAYTVTVQDGAGCNATELVRVTSGISLENIVFPIIDQSCATTSACHNNPSGGRPNLASKEEVISFATRIKARAVTIGDMPPAGNPELSQNEKDAIACWVDDGAPNN